MQNLGHFGIVNIYSTTNNLKNSIVKSYNTILNVQSLAVNNYKAPLKLQQSIVKVYKAIRKLKSPNVKTYNITHLFQNSSVNIYRAILKVFCLFVKTCNKSPPLKVVKSKLKNQIKKHFNNYLYWEKKMVNLKTLFRNHFNTERISDDNLRKFAEIHLERLSANNGTAQFTAMITSTTAAYQQYYGAMTSEDTKSAIQQGLTITMNTIVENFKKYVSQKEGIIKGNFGKESAGYQEFFPHGLTEYSNATLANIELLIDRMVTGMQTHQAALGPNLLTDIQTFQTNFKAARKAQLEKIGEVSAQKSTTSSNRDLIENELMKNVHLIASMFIGNVDRCMDFFDQSFIKGGSDNGDEEETPIEPTK